MPGREKSARWTPIIRARILSVDTIAVINNPRLLETIYGIHGGAWKGFAATMKGCWTKSEF